MSSKVEEIARKVQELPQEERDEFLAWLAEFEAEHFDAWDAEIARDSRPGGRLSRVMERVRRDVDEGRTRPLDEILDQP